MSLPELAATMGFRSPNSVLNIKNGTTTSIKLEHALRLCAAKNISPYYLGGWDSPKVMEPPEQITPAAAPAAQTAAHSGEESETVRLLKQVVAGLEATNNRIDKLDKNRAPGAARKAQRRT